MDGNKVVLCTVHVGLECMYYLSSDHACTVHVHVYACNTMDSHMMYVKMLSHSGLLIDRYDTF